MKTLFFLYFFYLSSPGSIRNTPLPFQEDSVPPREYILTLLKEADVVLRVKIKKVTLDSCKNCSSTGRLYVVQGNIIRKYQDKKGRIKDKSIIYLSATDTAVYKKKDIIVFLNKTEGRDVEKFKKVKWNARQATEFPYRPKTESFILSQKRPHA